MKGKIRGIAGPTVTTDLRALTLYEQVRVGRERLTGEVVRLESDRAVIQVYEDTRGLELNEVVEGTGTPLLVELGPGLLSSMVDGLQRPLDRLFELQGPFLRRGAEVAPLAAKKWSFHPLCAPGDDLEYGMPIGYFEEGEFRHRIRCELIAGGRLGWIGEGDFASDEPIARLEGGGEIYGRQRWPVRKPRPYRKKIPSGTPLVTGHRCIDFLFPLARGGTAIFPGGFGTGKTVLEQSIARFADADIVLYVGCGERGNEMADLIAEFRELNDPWKKRKLLERTILVVNTSNMPVAAREASIYTAATMAEYYRDMGYHVLLLADSISRWAEALREISSSLEEIPGEEGYPTYLASRLSGFIERAGIVETLSGDIGSLTMILAVSPPGGDFTEPVTQAALRAAGSFLMLDTSLAHARHFPAINWFSSYSLYARDLLAHFREQISPRWEELAIRCRDILQKESSLREVAEIIGIEGLQDGDRLLMKTAHGIRTEFLAQNAYGDDAFSPPGDTLDRIAGLLELHDRQAARLEGGVPLDEIPKEDV